MAVILNGSQPPLLDVCKVGPHASQVYCVLWSSAYMDVRYDTAKYFYDGSKKPWSELRHCGGTSHWTHLALSRHLGINRRTVDKACDELLTSGLLTIAGYEKSSKGKPHRIYRVTHPTELESVRHSIYVMGKYADCKCAPDAHKYTVSLDDREPDYFNDL